MASTEVVGRREVEQLVVRTLAAALTFVLASSIAVLVLRADEAGGFLGSATLSIGNTEAIGPLGGTDVDAYVRDRIAALARGTGARAAVVSFDRYATERQARAAMGELRIAALLVAAPAGRPEPVRGALDDWADRARAQATEERKGLERMAATSDDPDFVAQFRADAARLRRFETSVGGATDIVFGAVVVGPAARLRALARADGIRLVDVGASARVPSLAVVRGLRPEETVRAGEPAARPG